MDITVWEGITNNFKIEVIHFMVNTSNKFTVYNSNIEIQPMISLSPYITNAMIPNYLKDYGHSFTAMSLNCQSINAKFGLLEVMLHELLQSDFAYSAIGKISTGSQQNDHALMNASVIIYQP